MIRLHQSFGAHAGRRYELAQERIRIGRLPENEVAFDPHADLDASGRHAEIVAEGGAYVLVDVGSRNGTFVDGHRVDRLVLRGGEEIEFGPGGPRVRVELPAPGEGFVGEGFDAALGDYEPASGADVPGALIETTRINRAPQRSNDGLMRLAVAVLIAGVLIAVVAVAVLLGPTD
jgi:predicted component of type VI protein secretion system